MTPFAALRQPARSAGALLTGLIDLLLPPRCPACTALLGPRQRLCAVCEVGLHELADPCSRCGEPEAAPLCARCRREPPPFSGLHAPHLYGGPLGDALRRFKYRGHSELASPLAALLTDSSLLAAAWVEEIDLLLPVPLHTRRLRERGYNQAALLARPVARRLGRPLACRLLERVRETRAQASLDVTERRRNVQGAFVVPARAHRRLEAQRVLLIDDVATTGATAAACAKALRKGGARDVRVLVLARAAVLDGASPSSSS